MSATVKLAKEIDELDISQPTAECHLMAWPYKRRLVTRRDELPPVQGGTEDTDERVTTSHSEMCDGCEVTSVEEGHDVERVTARSEIVDILKQLKDETSADLTALEKKELDLRVDQSHRREGNRGFETGAECEGGGAEATTLERQVSSVSVRSEVRRAVAQQR